MFAIQSCPSYIDAIGGLVPTVALLGVIAIPIVAVGGRRLVASIGNPHASLAVAQTRNLTLAVTGIATILAILITGWLVANYPSNCLQWLPA